MTDDDIRRVVQAIKATQAEEFEAVHTAIKDLARRIDRLDQRVGEMETGLMNSIGELGRRLDRHMADTNAHR